MLSTNKLEKSFLVDQCPRQMINVSSLANVDKKTSVPCKITSVNSDSRIPNNTHIRAHIDQNITAMKATTQCQCHHLLHQ